MIILRKHFSYIPRRDMIGIGKIKRPKLNEIEKSFRKAKKLLKIKN